MPVRRLLHDICTCSERTRRDIARTFMFLGGFLIICGIFTMFLGYTQDGYHAFFKEVGPLIMGTGFLCSAICTGIYCQMYKKRLDQEKRESVHRPVPHFNDLDSYMKYVDEHQAELIEQSPSYVSSEPFQLPWEPRDEEEEEKANKRPSLQVASTVRRESTV